MGLVCDVSIPPYGCFCVRDASLNPNYGITHFDNILAAFLTIFQCVSLEGWTDVMYQLQDAVTTYCWTYFIVLVVFGSFFAVNLALAVLYLHFIKSGDSPDDGDTNHATTNGVATDRNGETDESNCVPVESSRLKRIHQVFYAVSIDARFEGLTMGLILLNTAIMAAETSTSPDWQRRMGEMANYVLTGYFTLEMVIKLIGLGFSGYVRDKMNTFDALIVIASLVEIGLKFLPSFSAST